MERREARRASRPGRPKPTGEPALKRVAPLALASLAAAGLVVSPALLLTGCATQPKPQDKPFVYVPPAGVEKYVAAVQAQKSGDVDSAIAALTEATTINPELTMARSMLGDLYKDKGDYNRAATQYEAVTELDPYTGRNFYKLGVIYHLLARLQEAITAYLQALKLDPRDWESSMNLGLVYLSLGQKDEAVATLSRATILNPGAAPAFSNLGVALDSTGRHTEAETAYRRALELSTDDGPALSNLAGNLMTQKKYREASVILTRLIEVNNSSTNRKRFGDALALTGRNDEALTQYTAALEREPDNYLALNGLGAVLIAKYREGLQLDDRTRSAALDAWRKSLNIKPGQPRVEQLLARWSK
jgi:tetratricopeptide (TPR) repeat protein